MAGIFRMPISIGAIRAAAPAAASAAFLGKLSLRPVLFYIIFSILVLRFAPVSPATQGKGDSW